MIMMGKSVSFYIGTTSMQVGGIACVWKTPHLAWDLGVVFSRTRHLLVGLYHQVLPPMKHVRNWSCFEKLGTRFNITEVIDAVVYLEEDE